MELFEEEATRILNSGWQQCSTFYPNKVVGSDLGLPEDAVFLVLTQACSVVSHPLARDPNIELIVASRVQNSFSERSPFSRGANARKFHLLLSDGENSVPYELDIYKRYFIPREKLLLFEPDGPKCSDIDAVRVANWVGRFYTRTALPSKLVNLLRDAKIQKKLETILSLEYEGKTIHEQVAVIFGRWEPDNENGPYQIELHIAVRSLEAQDNLLEILKKEFDLDSIEIDIAIKDVELRIEVPHLSTITLESFDEMRRISEWDLLSGLKEES